VVSSDCGLGFLLVNQAYTLYGLVTSVLRTFVIHVETVVHVVVRSGADGTTWMIVPFFTS